MKTYFKSIFVIFFLPFVYGWSAAQELTVYVLPSPLDRTWESPREIVLTTIKNMIYPEKCKKRYLGHAFIRLTNGDEQFITGSTYDPEIPVKNLVLKDGYGLGILTARIRGELESAENLCHELAQRYQTGNISFIRFKISPDMYERLKYYLLEYDKRGYDAIYNGQNKPREGKGAGCTAFAVSFIEVAGFLKEEWVEKWEKRARIPQELIGDIANDRYVSAIKVILRGKWAKENDPHVTCRFFDPNAMHHWIREKSKENRNNEYTILHHNKAIGLEFDFRNRKCPEETVFRGESESKKRPDKLLTKLPAKETN